MRRRLEFACPRGGRQATEVPTMRDTVRRFRSGREFNVDRSRDWTMPLRRHSISKTRPQTPDDLPIATSEGDLRETFDLPLLSGRDAESGHAASAPATADAAALFQDHAPAKRRVSAAEARSRARRCVHCGSGVRPGHVHLHDLRNRPGDRPARRPRRRPDSAPAASSSRASASYRDHRRTVRHSRHHLDDRGRPSSRSREKQRGKLCMARHGRSSPRSASSAAFS